MFALLAAGCGSAGGHRNDAPPPSGATLSGKVTFNGAPLGGGTVNVVSKTDKLKSAQGSIDRNGNYEVKNAPIGEVMIGVETESIRQFDPTYSKTAAKIPEGAGAIPSVRYVKIPAVYGNPERSKLSLTVTGAQTHNIELN
jgi:hypothetical protein